MKYLAAADQKGIQLSGLGGGVDLMKSQVNRISTDGTRSFDSIV